MKIILAGCYQQYTDWIYDNILPDVNGIKNYIFGNNVEKLAGIRADEIIIIGTFWTDVKNAGEIYNYAKSRTICTDNQK